MWRMLFASTLSVLTLAACQQSAVAGQQGWRMGPSLGPMMAYGYCPGATNDQRGAQRGWYGSGMMGGGGRMMGGGGGMMGSGGGMMSGRGQMMGGGMMGFDPEATSAWLDQANTEIGVTAAQEEAWSRYADAVETDRAAMLQMHDQMPSMMAAGDNAPDRLQAHLGMMSARLASLQQIEEATQALYAALTPEQRTRADQVLWSGCW